MIQIRYFGVLQTELNTASEQLAWQDGASTDELLMLLRSRGEPWFSSLASERIFKIAVNRQLIHQSIPISENAEVGFLPPVTGG